MNDAFSIVRLAGERSGSLDTEGNASASTSSRSVPAKVSTSAWEKSRVPFAGAAAGPPVTLPGAAAFRLTSIPAPELGDMGVAPPSPTGAPAVGRLIKSAAPKRPRSMFPIAIVVPPPLT